MNRYRGLRTVLSISAAAAIVLLFGGLSEVSAATANSHDYAGATSLARPNGGPMWVLAKGPGGRTMGGSQPAQPVGGTGLGRSTGPMGGTGQIKSADPINDIRVNPSEPVNGIRFDPSEPIND